MVYLASLGHLLSPSLSSFAIRNNKKRSIMKEDRDLSFLAYCKNEDLKTLVDMLTHDTNGEVRISEQLTNTDAYLFCYICKVPEILRTHSAIYFFLIYIKVD